MSLTIVIPAFNEESNLPTLLLKLAIFCAENQFYAIVVNDDSTDLTEEILRNFSSDRVSVLTNKVNKGYGGALKTGIRTVKTPYLISMDADGQHQFSDVLVLFNDICSADADMVIGSRKGQKSSSRFRGVGKSIIRTFARLYMKIDVYDINSGMKIYKTSLAQKFLRFAPDGMAFSDVMALVFINYKCYIREVRIQVLAREGGKSSINYKTAFNTIKEITLVATTFFPFKFFSSIAITILIITLIWGVPFVIHGKGITSGTAAGLLFSVLFFILGIMTELIALIRRDLIINSSENNGPF